MRMHVSYGATVQLEHSDLSLVKTYVPIIYVITKSILFTCMFYYMIFTTKMPPNVVLMIASCIIYVDFLFSTSWFEKVHAYMILTAVVVFAQPTEKMSPLVTQDYNNIESNSVMLWIIDVCWSIFSVFEIPANFSGVRTPINQLSKIIVHSVCLILHVFMSVEIVSLTELLFRNAIFTVLCAALVMCSVFLSNVEKDYLQNVSFICLHLLFVHMYCLLSSVMVLSVCHLRVVYAHVTSHIHVQANVSMHAQTNMTRSNDELLNKSANKNSAPNNLARRLLPTQELNYREKDCRSELDMDKDKKVEVDSLLQLLQEAKRQHGLV